MIALTPRDTNSLLISLNIIRRTFLVFFTITWLIVTLAAQDDKGITSLEPGKPIERELAGDQAHSYSIALTAGQYLHVVVEQKGIDVVVALFTPDGKKVAEVDSPNGKQGPEPISVLSGAAGNYRLEVRSLEAHAEAGRYQAKVEELRAAKLQDKSRIAAQQALAEGAQLASEGTSGSLRKAINKYQEALPVWRSANDRAKEAETLNSIGAIYDSVGEKQKALDFYNQALQLRRAVGDRRGEAVLLNNIGLVYDSLGEKQKALDFYSLALPTLRAVGDRSNEAVTLNNIGGVYDSLGERQKGLDFYNQALQLRRADGDRRGEAVTLNNIGGLYDSLGESQKALDYLNQALLLIRAVGNRRGEAGLLSNIGRVYDSLGERQKALEYLNQALPLIRAVGDRKVEAYTLTFIGGVYDSLGEKQKALDYYKQALPLERAVGDRSGEANTLASFATVERDRGNLIEARAQIEAALTIVESLRTKIASQELRSSYFATVQKYYDFYIDLLMRLHRQQPSAGLDGAALQASERGRARSLLEILTEANSDIRQGVDSKLLERERSLQQQLNAKAQQQTRLLNSKHSEDQANTIAKEIEALTTDFQQVEVQIRQTSPRYAALTQPQPLTPQQIQASVLDADTLLLEYALGEDKSYLWAVTPASITSYELPKRAEIEEAARQVYALVSDEKQWRESGRRAGRGLTTGKAQASTNSEALTRLSQMIIAPVAAQLGRKRLLIVSDGALQYIPFGALTTPAVGKTKPVPLIVAHEIVGLPSASTLAILRREGAGRTPAPKAVAVLADPVFEKNDVRVKLKTQTASAEGAVAMLTVAGDASAAATLSPDVAPASRTRILTQSFSESTRDTSARGPGRIPRLPGTRREAKQILALVTPALRKESLDFEASRTTATSDALSEYRYVHFATHGFLNSLHPELSGIVLSLVDANGKAQDGFLLAHEIFNLKLPAELVVLSACQTGLGKEIKGEGLVGLTRGFMYAGAPRVVVSLWNVSDEATAELMTRFYRGMLKEKLRPAAALRAAQVSLMKERAWESPFYWAAFTIQGEWR